MSSPVERAVNRSKRLERASTGERIVVNPRRAFLDRKEALLTAELEARQLADAPPGLLTGPDPPRRLRRIDPEYLQVIPVEGDIPGGDPYQQALRLQVRPGRKRSGERPARVRVYHRLVDQEAGDPVRCWAFTISRAAWERLLTERLFDSEGATYPDGMPVVPVGVDPLYVPVRCGTCGTHSVECLQIEFFED